MRRIPPPRAGFGASWALAAVLGIGPEPVVAQPIRELDSGSYEIRVNGRRVGAESFAIRREGSAVKAVGRVVAEREGPGFRGMDTQLQTTATFRPTAYALRARTGAVTAVDGVWERDRLRLHVSSTEGERWKEFLTRGSVAVLERGVAHHYYLLFQGLPSDPAGSRVSVIVPSLHQQLPATVSGGGREPVQIGKESIEAWRFEVTLGSTRSTVWLDSNGRVLRVAFPGENRVAVRQP